MLRIISKIVPTPHGRTNGIRDVITALAGAGIWATIAQLLS